MTRPRKGIGKLPKAEHEVLTLLKDKPWKSGEGWIYNNNSQQTRRVLDNLCKKGLVHKKDLTKKMDLVPTFYYTVTQLGQEVLQRNENT